MMHRQTPSHIAPCLPSCSPANSHLLRSKQPLLLLQSLLHLLVGGRKLLLLLFTTQQRRAGGWHGALQDWLRLRRRLRRLWCWLLLRRWLYWLARHSCCRRTLPRLWWWLHSRAAGQAAIRT